MKKQKILATILVAVMMLSVSATLSMAMNAGSIASQLTGTQTSAASSVVGLGNQIIGVITTVAVVVSVIVLLVLGIKYMMGSASEKAEYKKTMIPYLVGALFVFGAAAITKVVVGLASGIQV